MTEVKKEKEKTIADDDDDSISIQGPINVDKLSTSELMEIVTIMQSWAQKKRLK